MIKAQRGFTLVELLIAISIMGVMAGVLPPIFNHVVTIPEYGNERITALHELQNVAHWFNIDGQMAQSATGGNSLVLTMPDDSSISYALESTNLMRTGSGINMTLARNISYVNFSTENRSLTMNITSSPEGRWGVSENETYQICLRPTQE